MKSVKSDGLDIKFPVVIIFGAGATRGAFPRRKLPPPLDRDFFEIAGQIKGRGTPAIARKVLTSVWELYARTHGIGLEEYYREVETRARISSFAKSRNQPKDWVRRRRELEELIRRVFIHTTADMSATPSRAYSSPIHELLLKRLKSKCTVITFNYDLVIEESFAKTGLWNPRDGFGIKVSGISHEWSKHWYDRSELTNEKKKSVVTLLKLHGSLGWMQYSNRQIRIKNRPYVVRKGMSEKISIVPPGWNKPIDRNPYKELWRSARLKLERCKSLMIVGYSLPETDLLAKALFAEVVRSRVSRKEYLRNLFLVDRSEEIKEKFTALFTPTLGPYGKVFRFSSFEEIGSILGHRESVDGDELGGKGGKAGEPSPERRLTSEGHAYPSQTKKLG
jgi:hypothetical protein